MRANKAFLDFCGQTLLARALTALHAACAEVTIVGDPETYSSYGDVISDIFPNCGPLGGIHAALTYSTADLNLMLAVDMPFVAPDLLAFLLREAEGSPALVTLPRTSRGFQPLCAVYRRAFAAIAEQALRAGKYKIDALFAAIPIHVIAESDLSGAGFSENNFFNVNTPEDLASSRG